MPFQSSGEGLGLVSFPMSLSRPDAQERAPTVQHGIGTQCLSSPMLSILAWDLFVTPMGPVQFICRGHVNRNRWLGPGEA